jgi:RecB family exonuclease
VPDIAAAVQATLDAIETPYQTQTRALGPSKIASYLYCPRAFYLAYETGRRFPHNAEAVLGTAIHAVISHAHEWHWTERDKRSAADMLTDIMDAVPALRKESPAVELAYRSARDEWLPWYLHWQRGQETIAVEERWELDWEGIPLTGTIDRVYIDGVPVVSDIKSGKRAPNAEQLRTHLQLTLYDWAFCETCGHQPHGLQIVHLRGMKDGIYDTSRTPEYHLHVLEGTVRPVAHMIEWSRQTGEWPCNPGTLYGCHYCLCRAACPVGLGGNDDGGSD